LQRKAYRLNLETGLKLLDLNDAPETLNDVSDDEVIITKSARTHEVKGRIWHNWTLSQLESEYGLPYLSCLTQKYLLAVWSKEESLPDSSKAFLDDIRHLRLKNDLWQQFTVHAHTQISVQVCNFQDVSNATMHPVRCTGKRGWHNGLPRRDNIFLDRSKIGSYGSLRGRLPARVDAIFTIYDYILDKTHELAHITKYKPVAGGQLNNISRLVEVILRSDVNAHEIIPITQIHSIAHLVHNSYNERYIVNAHIDLNVFNHIY